MRYPLLPLNLKILYHYIKIIIWLNEQMLASVSKQGILVTSKMVSGPFLVTQLMVVKTVMPLKV